MANERNDFIRDIIDADLAAKRHTQIRTRFPPEPNGYLHIGHAKSISLNFGIALEYGGTCNLRYDDTNPTKEEVEYVESIERDVRWLGFSPTQVLYASDTFGKMYELAEKLITDGKAYVCSLDDEQIRVYRGTLSEPGKPSPDRDRPVAENLDLFRRMRAGEFPDGTYTLRAKIDMGASNMKMRDPLLYRIRHAHHHRTGDTWCIYPMYDYAHPLEDAFESITHSICTLEFENNRELYDWVVEHTGVPAKPRQYEFARLALDYTLMSKRKLLKLVEEKAVNGWDDPRMPTIAGMRRRGYRPEAIRAFCDMIGVAKNNSTVDIGKLEFAVRDDLNKVAPRALAVVKPLRVVLTTLSAEETIDAPSFPPELNAAGGTRPVPLAREILIDREDFQENPEKGYQRLAPGRTVRLRYGYCITCDEVVKDAAGNVVELRASHLPETLHGKAPADGRKVSGVIHWLSAKHAVPAELRMYDRLFKVTRPDEGGDVMANLNPESLVVVQGFVEPSLAQSKPGDRFQFERVGYFAVDPEDSKPGRLVFNRIVGLREAAPAATATTVPATSEPTDAAAVPVEKSAKAKTRPPKRSGAEFRAEARARDAELAAAFARYRGELGLSESEADLLAGDRPTRDLFEATVSAGAKPAAAAKLIVNELPRVLGDRELADSKLTAGSLAALLALLEAGTITGPAGKDVLAELCAHGGDARAIVESRGLAALADTGALEAIVDDVLAKNAAKVAEYRAGRTGLVGFFVGQVVRAAGGKASPQLVQEVVTKKLA
jgi:glutaminyl-tRNA synthetase